MERRIDTWYFWNNGKWENEPLWRPEVPIKEEPVDVQDVEVIEIEDDPEPMLVEEQDDDEILELMSLANGDMDN